MDNFELIRWINATLHNDEASRDEELIEHFCKCGLTLQEAQKAVSQRNKCLNDSYYEVKF